MTGLLNSIKSAVALSDPEKEIIVSGENKYPLLDISGVARDKYVTVLKLELDGPPRVTPPFVPKSADDSFLLNYESAITNGSAVKRFNRKGGYHISGWKNPDDSITWNLKVNKPGRFRVRLTYAALPAWAGQKFRVEAGAESMEADTEATGGWYDYGTFDLGTINLDASEGQFLEIRPVGQVRENLMYFKEILLEPEGQN